MNNWFNNLVIFNGYPLAVVLAVSLHVLILVALLYLQGGNRIEAMELVQPTVVTALFIDENPQVRNQRSRDQRRIQQQEAERRQSEEAAERQQEEAENRAAEAARREEEQARLEEERRQAALREREELERQQQLQAEREQRQREQEQAEQQRQRELAEAEERQRQQEAERRRRAAEEEAAAAAAARNEFELVQSATGMIQQIVQENWSRPPSARNGMRVVIRIQMLPTGELLNATVIESSGDAAFDRSAENAVYQAYRAPLTELQQLPIAVFNNNFRSLSLIFEPTDLLN